VKRKKTIAPHHHTADGSAGEDAAAIAEDGLLPANPSGIRLCSVVVIGADGGEAAAAAPGDPAAVPARLATGLPVTSSIVAAMGGTAADPVVSAVEPVSLFLARKGSLSFR